MAACFLAELLLTFFFLMIIIGTTSKGRGDGLRRHSDRIGAHPHSPDLDPDNQHLGQSGPQHRACAVRGGGAIGQLWLFIVAPIAAR